MTTFKELDRLMGIEEASRELEGFMTKMFEEGLLGIQGNDVACTGLLDRIGALQERLGKEKVEYTHGYDTSEYTGTGYEGSGEQTDYDYPDEEEKKYYEN